MRLIDADALMKALGINDMDCDKCNWRGSDGGCVRGGDFMDACAAIEDAPTIEPEVKFIRLSKEIGILSEIIDEEQRRKRMKQTFKNFIQNYGFIKGVYRYLFIGY